MYGGLSVAAMTENCRTSHAKTRRRKEELVHVGRNNVTVCHVEPQRNISLPDSGEILRFDYGLAPG